MSGRPTVFLVDDDASIRRTLPVAIRSSAYRVESFESGEAFLSKYDGQPGCLILDLSMPRMGGLMVQEQVLLRGWSLPIIFLTGFGTVDAATRAMKAGAIYFFEKPIDPALLIERIHEALAIDKQQRDHRAQHLEVGQRLQSLTRRQRQVLDLVVQGLTSRQIAEKLGRSIKTVEVHRSQILTRMEAQGVADLMRMVLAPVAAASPAPAPLRTATGRLVPVQADR